MIISSLWEWYITLSTLARLMPFGEGATIPLVCATGRPSLPRALDLGATHDLFAPLRDAAAVLRASRALFWRTRGSPTITGRRVDVLAGGLRQPARTYASRGLRASASLSLARSVRKQPNQGHKPPRHAARCHAEQ